MFLPQAIPEVILVEPKRFVDHRGFFEETFHSGRFAAAGIAGPFVQDNHSLSRERYVIRGLHFQIPPVAQAKLVRCTHGAILDVAVDIRRGSPTYGRHVAVELSAANGRQLFVPVGFAHGFCTLEPDSEVQYKVTDYYAPDCDRGIAHDDPALAIAWPAPPGAAVLSDRDRKHPRLAEMTETFEYRP